MVVITRHLRQRRAGGRPKIKRRHNRRNRILNPIGSFGGSESGRNFNGLALIIPNEIQLQRLTGGGFFDNR